MIKKIIYQIVAGTLIRLVPLRKKWILFSSFYGQHYSDGPKAISEYLHDNCSDLQLYWAFSKKEHHVLPEYVKPVYMNSFRYYIVKTLSKYIISNVYVQTTLTSPTNKALMARIHLKLSNRKRQVTITTWHGTPLKKIGNDAVNSDYTGFICNKPFYYVVGNKYERDIMMRITQNNLIPLEWGNPRNAFLLTQTDKDIESQKIKLNIPVTTKVILYAPTFRTSYGSKNENVFNSGVTQIEQLNIEELSKVLSRKFGGGEWILICRFHNNVENYINWDQITKIYNGLVINGNVLEDINDYYRATDVLITDYSSVMFDFMQTKRPIFLFCHDIENYSRNERGMYMQIGELPFSISKNYNDFANSISDFDYTEYCNKINTLYQKLGYFNDAERVYDRILELIKTK